MMTTLEQIRNRVKDMPSISGNTVKILNLIADLDYSVKDLAELISYDVSLSTRCLKIVNSAKFTLRSEVTSIERAVSFLGKQAIFGLVIESGFSFVFSSPLDGYNEDDGGLWDHSLRTAIASRLVAVNAGRHQIADLAYTAGLLHNIGKVIMSDFLRNHTDAIMEDFMGPKLVDFSEIESEYLEIDHGEVGQMMEENWGIPKSIQAATQFHHKPSQAPEEYKELCYIVHLGDHFAMHAGGSQSMDALSYTVDPEAANQLKLDYEAVDSLMVKIDAELTEAKEKIFSS